MIDKRYFDKAFLKAVDTLRARAPKKTGNLAYNAIKYIWLNDHQFEIYVDVGDTDAFVSGAKMKEGTAPYMPSTNEVWVSERWNNKQNPNQDWWNRAIEEIIKLIASILEGELQ